MVERAFAVYPHDSVHAPFVLRRDKEGRLAVMDEYEALVCQTCRKVDERAAFAQGIQKEVVVRSRRPVLGSLDDYYLVDERAKQVFAALFPGEIEFFPIPSGAFYVASARAWLQPEETNPGFRFTDPRCTACGRPGGVVWGEGPLVVPERRRFLAVNVEGCGGARETWLVSADAATELRRVSPPLTGVVLCPREVTIGGRG